MPGFPHYETNEIVALGLRPFGYLAEEMEQQEAEDMFYTIYGEIPDYFSRVWDSLIAEWLVGVEPRFEDLLYAKLCHRLYDCPISRGTNPLLSAIAGGLELLFTDWLNQEAEPDSDGENQMPNVQEHEADEQEDDEDED